MQRVLRLAVVLIVLIQVGGEIRVCAMGEPLWNGKPAPLTEVLIGGNRIAVPLKRIILVRFDSSYCAVRFTKADWGKTEAESFSEYESWVQEDGSGDFSKLNVVYTRDDLWWKTPIGIGRMWLFKRAREEIRCGPVTLR